MNNETNNKSIDSKEFFIQFLDTEIEQLREEIKTPGWTIWAVIGAVASIIWLLVLEVEKKVFDLDQTLLLFLMLYFVATFLTMILNLIKPTTSKGNRYIAVGELLGWRKHNFLYGIPILGAIILLLYYFSANVDRFTYYSALLCSSALIFVPFGLYGIDRLMRRVTHTNLYVPDFSKPGWEGRTTGKFSFVSKRTFFYIVILVVLLLYGYWFVSFGLYYVSTYGTAITITSISSLKIAALVISIILLLRLPFNSSSSLPSFNNLIDIRRDLVFDNINLDVARELAEVSLYGLDKSAVLQTEVSGCISTLQHIDTELNKAIKNNEAAMNLLSEATNETGDDVLSLWKTLRDASLSNFKQARKLYLSDERLHHGLVRFFGLYERIDPGNADYGTYLEKISSLYDLVKGKYDNTVWTWLKLINNFEGKENASYWLSIAVEDLQAELPQVFDTQ